MKIAKLLIPMALAALIVSPIKAQDKLYINKIGRASCRERV